MPPAAAARIAARDPPYPFAAAQAVAAAAFWTVLAARAEVVDIVWGHEGRFARSLNIAPGEFVELCGLLEAGASLQWRFEADPPLDFNIHFHLGKDVRYPARADQARQADGTLAAHAAEEYCWMCSNNAAAAARVQVDLERR